MSHHLLARSEAQIKPRLSRSKHQEDEVSFKTAAKDHLIIGESPTMPGVPVVFRPPEERAANPDRLNLDRRQFTSCPILEVWSLLTALQ